MSWPVKVGCASLALGLLYGSIEWAAQFIGMQGDDVPTAAGVAAFVAYAVGRWHERNSVPCSRERRPEQV
jgi:hypothetical protein